MSDARSTLSPERAAEVLAALLEPGDAYPADMVEEAIEHIDQLEPHLVAVLEAYADDWVSASSRLDGMAPALAAHLLANARKTSAHRPLLKILRLPGEEPYDVFGDHITEGMSMLLWQTCGADLSGVLELARDRGADPYVRGACLGAFSYAWADGALPRGEAIAVLQEVLTSATQQGDEYPVVSKAASLLCDLHPAESMDLLEEVFRLDLTDPFWIDWSTVEGYAERDRDQLLQEERGELLAKLEMPLHKHLWWWSPAQREQVEALDERAWAPPSFDAKMKHAGALDEPAPARPSFREVGQPPLRTKEQERRERNKKKQARKARKENRRKRK